MANGNGIANGNGKNSQLIDKFMTALAGGAIGVLITYVTAVSNHSQKLASLTARMDALVEKVEASMDDRYRGNDAVRDLQLRDHRISENAANIRELQKYHRLDRKGD